MPQTTDHQVKEGEASRGGDGTAVCSEFCGGGAGSDRSGRCGRKSWFVVLSGRRKF